MEGQSEIKLKIKIVDLEIFDSDASSSIAEFVNTNESSDSTESSESTKLIVRPTFYHLRNQFFNLIVRLLVSRIPSTTTNSFF